MKANKINDADISALKVASLPTRPTTPAAFGGSGYTASEVKAAFDRLPLYVIERFNELIDDIKGESGGDITDALKTGINSTKTLRDFFDDVLSGAICDYFGAPNGTLREYLTSLRRDVDAIISHFGITIQEEV